MQNKQENWSLYNIHNLKPQSKVKRFVIYVQLVTYLETITLKGYKNCNFIVIIINLLKKIDVLLLSYYNSNLKIIFKTFLCKDAYVCKLYVV